MFSPSLISCSLSATCESYIPAQFSLFSVNISSFTYRLRIFNIVLFFLPSSYLRPHSHLSWSPLFTLLFFLNFTWKFYFLFVVAVIGLKMRHSKTHDSQILPCNILFFFSSPSTFILADLTDAPCSIGVRATTSMLSSRIVAVPHGMYASLKIFLLFEFIFFKLSNSLSRVAFFNKAQTSGFTSINGKRKGGLYRLENDGAIKFDGR